MAMLMDPKMVPGGYNNHVYTSTFQCANEACRRLSIGTVHRGAPYGSPKVNMPEDPNIVWEPRSVRRPEFDDVPAQIAETASEAHASLSIQAYRGSVALARAVDAVVFRR